MRAQRPDLKVAYLTDGAVEFETLYDHHLKLPLGPDVVSLVDFWHAAEYLGAAARVLEVKRKAKPGQFRRWRHALKHDVGAAAAIVEQMEQSGLAQVMLDGTRPVEAARATKPLAKPVQIAAGVHAVKSTRAAAVTSVHGARAAA